MSFRQVISQAAGSGVDGPARACVSHVCARENASEVTALNEMRPADCPHGTRAMCTYLLHGPVTRKDRAPPPMLTVVQPSSSCARAPSTTKLGLKWAAVT